jgi:hypothetical protein
VATFDYNSLIYTVLGIVSRLVVARVLRPSMLQNIMLLRVCVQALPMRASRAVHLGTPMKRDTFTTACHSNMAGILPTTLGSNASNP